MSRSHHALKLALHSVASELLQLSAASLGSSTIMQQPPKGVGGTALVASSAAPPRYKLP
eukprot:CAMPEP_0177697286 /NCGR_PEP_ID=MMETSP0484_2-20121128/4433_1 /TAXON_ID=354590 /ORGANISM="Rhodomonas lens, Strain RHODO" /LENGTH=58 /DNA_ID=CAMNT_0019208315 /DNA_START=226 /DNA_END=402 /DNA_ORIENTATION=+